MIARTRLALAMGALSASLIIPPAGVASQGVDPVGTTAGLCSGVTDTGPLLAESGTSENALSIAGDLPERRRLAGKWQDLERLPFAGPFKAAVWTGDKVLIVKSPSGRTATYDPETKAWVEGTPLPHDKSMDAGPSTWTDDELVVVGDTSAEVDGPAIGGLAYRPATDSWREIADLTVNGDPWQGVSDAIWTDDELIVISYDLHVAAYRPDEDCWVVLPDVPAVEDGRGWRIYWSGDSLLAETRSMDEGIAVSAWDPGAMAWGDPSQGPSEWLAGGGGGYWVDGELAYFTKNPGGLEGLLDARLDPGSMVWRETSHDCESRGGHFAIEAAGLLVDRDAFQAMDPRTGVCYVLPRRKPPLNRGQVVSTGKDVLYLSGSRGESDSLKRRAWAFGLAEALKA